MADRRSKRFIFFKQAAHQLTDEGNIFLRESHLDPKVLEGL